MIVFPPCLSFAVSSLVLLSDSHTHVTRFDALVRLSFSLSVLSLRFSSFHLCFFFLYLHLFAGLFQSRPSSPVILCLSVCLPACLSVRLSLSPLLSLSFLYLCLPSLSPSSADLFFSSSGAPLLSYVLSFPTFVKTHKYTRMYIRIYMINKYKQVVLAQIAPNRSICEAQKMSADPNFGSRRWLRIYLCKNVVVLMNGSNRGSGYACTSGRWYWTRVAAGCQDSLCGDLLA